MYDQYAKQVNGQHVEAHSENLTLVPSLPGIYNNQSTILELGKETPRPTCRCIEC